MAEGFLHGVSETLSDAIYRLGACKSRPLRHRQSEKVSLNALANESTYKLIDTALAKGFKIQEVFVDTVGDASKWQAKLSDRYRGITFVVCPKADALYSIVSAASIVAKVTRDRELKGFICKEAVTVSTTFGTGYPADPETVAWLKQHLDPVFGFPSLVRFSWQTCTRLLDDKGLKSSGNVMRRVAVAQMCLTFGGKVAATKSSSGAGRHSFSERESLQRVV
eukprot:jgi/Botrbrau1/18091/Bobra.0702s0001.1